MSRVLENFIVKLKKDVQANLLKKEQQKANKYGGSANGNSKLWGTIKAILEPNSDPSKISLVMQNYWYWVDGARKAGRVSRIGQDKLSDWIKRKGVNPSKIIDAMKLAEAQKKQQPAPKKKTPFAKAQKQFAFIVARKLKAKGYPANHFYSEIINDGRLDRLKIDLKEELRQDIIIQVKNVGNTN